MMGTPFRGILGVMEGYSPLKSEAPQGKRETCRNPPETHVAEQPQAGFPPPERLEPSPCKGVGGSEDHLDRRRLRGKRQVVSPRTAGPHITAPRSGCRNSAERPDAAEVTGEALLEASAAEAALLAKKAEGLSQVLGIGQFTKALAMPSNTNGARDNAAELPEIPAEEAPALGYVPTEAMHVPEQRPQAFKFPDGVDRRQEDASALLEGAATANSKSLLDVPSLGDKDTVDVKARLRCLSNNRPDLMEAQDNYKPGCAACTPSAEAMAGCEGMKSLHLAPGVTFDEASEGFTILVDGNARTFPIRDRGPRAAYQHALSALLDQELAPGGAPGEPRDSELSPGSAGAERAAVDRPTGVRATTHAGKDPELAEAESLFATPCSDSIEQLQMAARVCQPEELKLARTAVLICLADLREACIPDIFAHPIDRKLRRKRVELHMIHVQECNVMQQLKPYMHLFELALVRDLLPHKLHPVAQRLLFSSLDMHARASESLYFPTYFGTD